jgi:hypothetical protein
VLDQFAVPSRRCHPAGQLLNVARFLLLAVALGACATPETTPSAAVTTVDPAAIRWFNLEWSTQPDGSQSRRIDGYIVNTYGQPAEVQLLAQALDASGKVVDQKIEYTLFPVPGFGRSYFNIGRLVAADHYQVTVWSAYFLQRGGS